MPRRFRHVTEFKSHINDEIKLGMMLNGKSVNTPGLRSNTLPPLGVINIDVHDLKEWLRFNMPNELMMIGVSVNGKLKLILAPIYILLCVRISFHYHTCSGGNVLLRKLTARGLKEKKVDIWCRIRCMEHKRQKEYMNREAIPRLVWENIGEPVHEGEEMNETSENSASEPVVTHPRGGREEIEVIADDSSSDRNDNTPLSTGSAGELLGGQASCLKYEETPLVEGQSRKVANITNRDVYGSLEEQFGQFGNTLIIGYNGEDMGSLEINLVMEMKEFRHCKVNVLTSGFFVFTFSSLEHQNMVLEKGQLFINKRPLILRRWSPDLDFGLSFFLSALPIWVRFYNIPRQNWTKEYLSEVSGGIGVFLYMDKCTALKRFDFARFCLEVDPCKELPDTVLVAVGNKTITIEITYEWKPQCTSLSHATSSKVAREEVSLRREDTYLSIEELRLSDMAGDDGGGDNDFRINFGGS